MYDMLSNLLMVTLIKTIDSGCCVCFWHTRSSRWRLFFISALSDFKKNNSTASFRGRLWGVSMFPLRLVPFTCWARVRNVSVLCAPGAKRRELSRFALHFLCHRSCALQLLSAPRVPRCVLSNALCRCAITRFVVLAFDTCTLIVRPCKTFVIRSLHVLLGPTYCFLP